jgi:hypothetical protein
MPGCHAVFDVDQECMKKCTFAECYECRRGFCIACQKPWHPGNDPIFSVLHNSSSHTFLLQERLEWWMILKQWK